MTTSGNNHNAKKKSTKPGYEPDAKKQTEDMDYEFYPKSREISGPDSIAEYVPIENDREDRYEKGMKNRSRFNLRSNPSSPFDERLDDIQNRFARLFLKDSKINNGVVNGGHPIYSSFNSKQRERARNLARLAIQLADENADELHGLDYAISALEDRIGRRPVGMVGNAAKEFFVYSRRAQEFLTLPSLEERMPNRIAPSSRQPSPA